MFEKVFGFFISLVSNSSHTINEVYYIGGNDILPPPLAAEEEASLLDDLEQGDTSVKRVLIERNLRLVVYIARKFENTGVDIEDLTSIGTLGLINASRCIENEILMYLRKNSRARTEVSFEEPLNVDWDGNELLLSDILGTDSDIIQRNLEEETDKKLLVSAMNKLSGRERRIMELRFGLNNHLEKTQKEVADMLGISQSYISRLEKRILGRLKREICRML